jgi:protein required for attachment to host cells
MANLSDNFGNEKTPDTQGATWVVVADAARARLFKATGFGKLAELEDMANPYERRESRNLASDEPGRGPRTSSFGHHTASHSVAEDNPKAIESARFAKDIATRLEDARQQKALGRVFITAAPQFLGQLRDALPAPTAQRVCGSLAKDLSKHDIQKIAEALAQESTMTWTV